jgi:hypothetical protein
MPKATESKTTHAAKEAEVKVKKLTFKCKFCESEKPIEDMVMLRRYYPPKAACKECARIV